MSPCGMIMDMGTELRLAMMQLSADPDDWVWVRLYRCRDTARVRPGLSVYCNPIWDDTNQEQPPGPSIRLRPSVNRRWVYAPAPGLDFRGEQEWYERGIPAADRTPGETGAACYGELWDATVGLAGQAGADEAPDVFAMETGGGGEGGGPVAMGLPCVIPYGYCLHVGGGGEGGGPVTALYGYGLSPGGGGEGGGPVEADYPAFVIGATANDNAVGTHSNLKPTGTAAGDLLLIVDRVYQVAGVTPPLPAGFTSLSTGTSADGVIKWRVSYKVAGAGEPANYAVSQGAARPVDSVVVTVRGFSGTPVFALADAVSAAPTAPSVALALASDLLVCVYGITPGGGVAWTGPAGMALEVASATSGSARAYKEWPAAAGASGARAAAITGGAKSWHAVSVTLTRP